MYSKKKITLSEEFAHMVANLDITKVKTDFVEQAKLKVLDIIGCSLMGIDNVTSSLALDYAEKYCSSGPSTIYLGGRKVRPVEAGFVNTILAHSLLHDDVARTAGHPGIIVVPTAIAVCEAFGSTGADLLAAILAGYEVQVRLASVIPLNMVGDRGFRPTTTTSAVGAAATAARSMRFSPIQTAHALAIGLGLGVFGLEQALNEGSYERCLHMAANTASGIKAAELASLGFEGAREAFDGESGYLAVFKGNPAVPPEITKDLGVHFLIGEPTAKPYPTAGMNLSTIWALEQILRDNPISVSEVQRIEVKQHSWGRATAYIFPGPFRTIEQALIACPFAMACTIKYGHYDWETVKKSFRDPEIDALAQKVVMNEVVPESTSSWLGYRRYGEVTVILNNGRRIHRDASNIDPKLYRPDRETQIQKFELMAAPVIKERVKKVIDIVIRLEDVRNLSELTSLLVMQA